MLCRESLLLPWPRPQPFEVDLEEGEWYDYDDKASQEVFIKELKWEIRRA